MFPTKQNTGRHSDESGGASRPYVSTATTSLPVHRPARGRPLSHGSAAGTSVAERIALRN